MSVQVQNGEYVVGVLQELKTEPWRNDPSKVNHKLIVTNPYNDSYGNPQTEVKTIDVSGESLSYLNDFIAKNKGQRVMIPIRTQGKSWRSKWCLVVALYAKGNRDNHLKGIAMQFITCPGTATSVLNGSSDIIRCDVPFESYTLEEVRDMVFENSAAQQSSMTESDF